MKKIQEHLGLVFLIIIAIFAVAIGGYFTLRKGVFIGDDFYYKVRADKFVHNTVNYVERTKDDTFLLVADGKKQNVSYTMKGDQVTFSFADDTINGTWTGDQLLAADGSPVGWDEMQIIAGNEKPVISDETYSNALMSMADESGQMIRFHQCIGTHPLRQSGVDFILGIYGIGSPYLCAWNRTDLLSG